MERMQRAKALLIRTYQTAVKKLLTAEYEPYQW